MTLHCQLYIMRFIILHQLEQVSYLSCRQQCLSEHKMKLLNTITRNLFRFSSNNKQKNVAKYLKTKKAEETALKVETELEQHSGLKNAHYMLYLQFVPAALIAIPIIYYIPSPSDLNYLLSCNLMQYYASGILCFNCFFTQQNKNKYLLLLLAVGGVNCLSGPFSLASPILLGLLNLYFPFTDAKFHRFETLQQVEKGKSYLGVQGGFYFMVILLVTLKSYYYLSLKQIENKLNSYSRENLAYYKLQEDKTN